MLKRLPAARGALCACATAPVACTRSARGEPEQLVELGPVGAFDLIDPDPCVRLLDGRAAHLWSPERCRP
ncbi:hypothetical protein [Nannocystis pusilla]|uniref:Secreted protein n=1 Tax=Nannocystis pusilla TaxID=889268 RepID=A0ABS7U0I0_9BACT|nr:hypothetical protein [Nannocystis pusilla]MBZ5714027.1 hypothetical protein [Nannocystis pusilla]